ncbi:carboxypeptidase B1 [Anabrus simplex]|uniref:carboxypeptidase B1 n=1 Tax=Anabrus simplex TaxID=316456 RepID=UPI0035A2D45E
MWRVLVLVLLLGELEAERKNYSGCKVFRLSPSRSQRTLLDQFYDRRGYDVWCNANQTDIMVFPDQREKFMEFLSDYRMPYTELISDVERVLDAEQQNQRAFSNTSGRITFDRYYRHDEINNYLDKLAYSHADLVKIETIGASYEGRSIKMVKLSESTHEDQSRPAILIDAGVHAREWISPAMALFIIDQLTEDKRNRHLLNNVDWYIIPVLNPDGYEYTHTTDRMWRNTRSRSRSNCYGVDINRNFDFHWGEEGASKHPCSEIYAGSQPFSEAETRALRDLSLSLQGRIQLYLSLHSYGNFILYPWGFTVDLADDADILDSLARTADAAQVKAGGQPYRVGPSARVLYPSAGASDDWEKAVIGVKLSYTVELPGGGRRGFDIPPKELKKNVAPFFEAIRVFGSHISSYGQQNEENITSASKDQATFSEYDWTNTGGYPSENEDCVWGSMSVENHRCEMVQQVPCETPVGLEERQLKWKTLEHLPYSSVPSERPRSVDDEGVQQDTVFNLVCWWDECHIAHGDFGIPSEDSGRSVEVFKIAFAGNEKAFCVIEFAKTEATLTVQRRFRICFHKDAPGRRTTIKWYQTFEHTGCLCPPKRLGRSRQSEVSALRVRELFQRSPQYSTTRDSLQLGMSQAAVWGILRKQLRMKPYRQQILHVLTDGDKEVPTLFATDVQAATAANDDFGDRLVFSDYATIHVSGNVNRYNVRIWRTERPEGIIEHVLEPPKDQRVLCPDRGHDLRALFLPRIHSDWHYLSGHVRTMAYAVTVHRQ